MLSGQDHCGVQTNENHVLGICFTQQNLGWSDFWLKRTDLKKLFPSWQRAFLTLFWGWFRLCNLSLCSQPHHHTQNTPEPTHPEWKARGWAEAHAPISHTALVAGTCQCLSQIIYTTSYSQRKTTGAYKSFAWWCKQVILAQRRVSSGLPLKPKVTAAPDTLRWTTLDTY